MTHVRFTIGTVLIALIATQSAHADSKWSWNKLNPFTKKPAVTRQAYPLPPEPSMTQKISRGTKDFFAKSKQLVPAWMMPQTQDRIAKSTRSASDSADRVDKELRTARRNILAPWRQDEPAPMRPETIPDFLGQDRPEF